VLRIVSRQWNLDMLIYILTSKPKRFVADFLLAGYWSVSGRYLVGISLVSRWYLVGISLVSRWYFVGISSAFRRHKA